MTRRRWLITGCSTGLGRDLAERLAADGEQVLATARNPESLAGLDVLTAPLDVRDDVQCAAAVALATERFGGVDVLVNNAGYGQLGVIEEVGDGELADQFDTNVYGPWRLTRHMLPLWRAQGGGHAIFSGSVSGTVALPGFSAYTASKYALEGLAESLAAEAGQFGVKVTILQLGPFATAYGDNARLPTHPVEAYQPLVSGMRDGVRALATSGMGSPPSLFADVVRRVADLPDPPLRLPVGPLAFAMLDPVLTARRASFDAARDDVVSPAH
jgi:NAD(P)-dependent dehydrogenase (short-subunit alcohol dehydrogenase family)